MLSEIKKIARTATAAAMLTVVPGVQPPPEVYAESSHQQVDEASFRTEDRERTNHNLALDIMRQFVDLSSDPFIKDLYRKVLQNPEEHVGIIDPMGSEQHWVRNYFNYFIYAEPMIKEDPEGWRYWSVLVATEDSNREALSTVISFQLNSTGHVFSGPGDTVAPPGFLPLTTKALQSDYLFNIPAEMQQEDWLIDLSDPTGTSWKREYLSPTGELLTQIIGPSNIISLTTMYHPRQNPAQR